MTPAPSPSPAPSAHPRHGRPATGRRRPRWTTQAAALAAGLLTLFSPAAWSAEHVIRMLDVGTDGPMVFEPAWVQAEVGDTLRFVPTSSGHHVRSLAVPEGASPWLSPLDQPFEVRLERPGLYVYNCPPHLMMGMVGLVQVGPGAAAPNRERAIATLKATKGRIYTHGERIDALLQALK
ncbi:plastocyanin/azurin family copper-binding protein [Pseudaquabacterium rugosum]|jgi:pseudoazurin|uniref:Plastocyanin/azurin family copper-binding protein n=1 Tax=Pseudaquabacterium rugosum TaxID=2984194 RepID=A0ABU9B834_9BURK